MTDIEKIKILITRVKTGTKSGILWTEEHGDNLKIEMIGGRIYGVMIKEIIKGGDNEQLDS